MSETPEQMQARMTGKHPLNPNFPAPAPGDEGAMTLGELVMRLEAAAAVNPSARMGTGLGPARSFRGWYVCPAFEPVPGLTVAESLANARAMLDADMRADVEGFKARVTAETHCYVAREECSFGPFTDDNPLRFNEHESACLTPARLLRSLRGEQP